MHIKGTCDAARCWRLFQQEVPAKRARPIRREFTAWPSAVACGPRSLLAAQLKRCTAGLPLFWQRSAVLGASPMEGFYSSHNTREAASAAVVTRPVRLGLATVNGIWPVVAFIRAN